MSLPSPGPSHSSNFTKPPRRPLLGSYYVNRSVLPFGPVIDPVYRSLAYLHTPSCTRIDGGLLKAAPTAREQRKKTMGRRRNRRSFRYDRRSAFRLGRVVMVALIIIVLVLILVRLLQ
jgi:hypothetical protein